MAGSSMDDECSRMVLLIRLAGLDYQATSAGLKEQEAINFLEKKMKNDPGFSFDETVQVYNKTGSLFLLLFSSFFFFNLIFGLHVLSIWAQSLPVHCYWVLFNLFIYFRLSERKSKS